MWTEKQKDDVQKLAAEVARREKQSDWRSFDIRPILPMDLGLETWVWSVKDRPTESHEYTVRVQPQEYIALYGIHSRYLLQVVFRTVQKTGNAIAVVSTGQILYEPYLWLKEHALWVSWQWMEPIPPGHRQVMPFHYQAAPFSILGFVIELMGRTVA